MGLLDEAMSVIGDRLSEIVDELDSLPAHESIPEDQGGLRGAQTATLEQFDENGFRIAVEFPQPSGTDFNYPRFINETVEIRPTRAQALSWVNGNGERVFSKGFLNPNHRWFDDRFVPWLEEELDRLI